MVNEMEKREILERIAGCDKLLIGFGEEWRVDREDPQAVAGIREAYEALYRLIRDKDYFIVTMAMDAVIFDTSLGSTKETVTCTDLPLRDEWSEESLEKGIDADLLAKMDQLFPKKEAAPEKKNDTCIQRITAPCGNITWRQCSKSCTKDIWEPGEIPDDICPHCGAPLTGNTMEAETYIEEGYLPQWKAYTDWLSRSFHHDLLILELGVGFSKPGIIRFPFEKTAFFNQKAFLCRVNEKFPQTEESLGARAAGIAANSVRWIKD
jgi:hypothetical protein